MDACPDFFGRLTGLQDFKAPVILPVDPLAAKITRQSAYPRKPGGHRFQHAFPSVGVPVRQ